MPGTPLGAFYTLSWCSPHNNHLKHVLISSPYYSWGNRGRGCLKTCQGHMSSNWRSSNLNQDICLQKPAVLSMAFFPLKCSTKCSSLGFWGLAVPKNVNKIGGRENLILCTYSQHMKPKQTEPEKSELGFLLCLYSTRPNSSGFQAPDTEWTQIQAYSDESGVLDSWF